MKELDIKQHFHYDHTDQESILARARMLKGKTLGYVSENSPYEEERVNKANKGRVGLFIEKHWFGIKNNSRPEPDFVEAGIELKVCSIKDNKGLTVKWNQKICSINYYKLHDEEWVTSHVKLKTNKILFVYYLVKDDDKAWSNQKILDVDLWHLKPNEGLITPEWKSARDKVREGFAHKLTIKGCDYIGANTSGTIRLVPQPIQIHQKLAKERSFYFQRKFVNNHWQRVRKCESIVESLQLTSIKYFEPAFLEAVNKYQGKTIGEIANKFNFNISKNKDAAATIIKLMLGFKTVRSKIRELDERGITVKTIPINSNNNSLYEAVSFRRLVLKDFIKEEWSESLLIEQLTRILFVAVSRNKRQGVPVEDRVLMKAFFWSPTENELKVIKQEWLNYQKQVNSGLIIEKILVNSKRGFKEIVTNISKESDTKIIHLRPHAKDSNDRDEDIYGTSVVKQSFWLNKRFVEKILKDSLNE